jgi:alcohol dehydrogenase class IV
MKVSARALALFATLSISGAALADCVAPEDPQIPQGTAATGADMLKAKKAVEGFVSEAEAYMACGVAVALQERMASKLEKVVENFNSELRAYKAKG